MNKDSAIDYLIVAHTALQSHDKVKSERLVRKAQTLCPDLNPRKEDLLGSQCHLFARFEDLDAVIVFVQQYGTEPTRNTTRTPPTPTEEAETEKMSELREAKFQDRMETVWRSSAVTSARPPSPGIQAFYKMLLRACRQSVYGI